MPHEGRDEEAQDLYGKAPSLQLGMKHWGCAMSESRSRPTFACETPFYLRSWQRSGLEGPSLVLLFRRQWWFSSVWLKLTLQRSCRNTAAGLTPVQRTGRQVVFFEEAGHGNSKQSVLASFFIDVVEPPKAMSWTQVQMHAASTCCFRVVVTSTWSATDAPLALWPAGFGFVSGCFCGRPLASFFELNSDEPSLHSLLIWFIWPDAYLWCYGLIQVLSALRTILLAWMGTSQSSDGPWKPRSLTDEWDLAR